MKSTKNMLQRSLIPIWNPKNQGYKMYKKKIYQDQQKSQKNSSEKSVPFLFADSV